MLALAFAPPALASEKTPPPASGLIRYEMPRFPVELVGIKAGDGDVVLVITIDADGKVNDSVVLEATNEAFANAASRTVSEWLFEPADSAAAPASATTASGRKTWPRREILQFSFKRSGVVTTMSHREAALDSFVVASTPALRTVLRSQLDSEPQRLAGVMPAISRASFAKRGGEPLMISFVLDREGQVRVPIINAADDPALAQTVLKAVQQWRYTPPLHKQQAVAVEINHALALPQK